MQATTTFSKDKIETFHQIAYISIDNKNIIFQANIDNKYELSYFFRNCSKVNQQLKLIDNDRFQFAFISEHGKTIPVKWFNIHLNGNNVISHDIAFSTTLIEKNGLTIPFGLFPFSLISKRKVCGVRQLTKLEDKLYSYRREWSIKARAYKYISNQILKVK